VTLVLTIKTNKLNRKFNPWKKIVIWVLVRTVAALTWVGANPVEEPYTEVGQILTGVYFSLFIII
jgi:ubiquinol-cytochrome c reductase cytochrome b subunit